eukprot:scaffold435518_cov20-Prasinocladus_malaysianus.AAC.1
MQNSLDSFGASTALLDCVATILCGQYSNRQGAVRCFTHYINFRLAMDQTSAYIPVVSDATERAVLDISSSQNYVVATIYMYNQLEQQTLHSR